MGNRQRKPKTDKHAVGAGFKPAPTVISDSHGRQLGTIHWIIGLR